MITLMSITNLISMAEIEFSCPYVICVPEQKRCVILKGM